MAASPGSSSSQGSSSPALPNKLQSQFEILGEINRGGMGVVYRAKDRGLGREVAIKVITGPQELTDILRFQREAQVLAQIQHKNVARIWDFGWHNQTPFLVMEYVEGPTLAQVVKEHLRIQGTCPDPIEIARIMAALADALRICHKQGIVHRDLKPDNIILSKGPNNEDRVVLLDFGVAKRDPTLGPDGRSIMLTETGELLGTPAFMAPEQFSPNSSFGPIGLATDIWGFGATLFYCLTGDFPYDTSNGSIGIFEAMMAGGPKRVQSLNLAIPPWLDLLCAACLRRSTKNRPDMKALVWQLKRQLDEERPKSLSGVSLFDSQWHDREVVARSPVKLWWIVFLALLILPPTVMAIYILNSGTPLPKDHTAELKKLRRKLELILIKQQQELKISGKLELQGALKTESKIKKLEADQESVESQALFAKLRLLEAEKAYRDREFRTAKNQLLAAKSQGASQSPDWLLLSGLVAAKDPSQSDAQALQLLKSGQGESSEREDVLSTMAELYIREKEFDSAQNILLKIDKQTKRYPELWIRIAIHNPSLTSVERLISEHGQKLPLSSDLEQAFLKSIKIYVSRDDIDRALRCSKTLFQRKKDSLVRAEVALTLSKWMLARFGYAGWGDDFYQKQQLRKSMALCAYLSDEFGPEVPKKLWDTFGDFIIFCLGPAHKFNTYRQLETLCSHLTRWRPNDSRSWLIYSELNKRCISHLSPKRKEEVARTYPKAFATAKNNDEKMILRFRYSSFYRQAGLGKEALKTISLPSKAEKVGNIEIAANMIFERALIYIDLGNSEPGQRVQWRIKALETLKLALETSPDLMKRTDALTRIGNLQREHVSAEAAIKTYLKASKELAMREELEHRWSTLVFQFFHAVESQSKAPIALFRQNVLERSRKTGANCPWMYQRLNALLLAYELWSVQDFEGSRGVLLKLAAQLPKTQQDLAKLIAQDLTQAQARRAAIIERFRALAINIHKQS